MNIRILMKVTTVLTWLHLPPHWLYFLKFESKNQVDSNNEEVDFNDLQGVHNGLSQRRYKIKCENVKLKNILSNKNFRIESLEFEKVDLNDKLNFCNLKKLN